MHVLRAGERLRVRGRLLDGFARGTEAELGEALDVRERQLREVGELIDGSFVGCRELVDLQHGNVLGLGWWADRFAALHNSHFRPFSLDVKGLG